MTQVLLTPVQHKDAYTRAVEVEVVAYFREAVFTPLLIQLLDAGVPVDPKYQEIRFDEEGRENEALTPFPESWGSLGVPRDQMPQIPAEARGALTQFLEARGISHFEVDQPVTALRPTQAGYHAEKVKEVLPGGRAILVSRDGYILDGHHQYTAIRLQDEKATVRTLVFAARIRSLLHIARTLPSSERANAAATSAVRAALESGRIHYADGKFTGRFSSAIAKELRSYGATFNAEQKTYSLAANKLPADLSASIVDSLGKAKTLHADVVRTLTEIETNVALVPLNLGPALTAAVDRVIIDAGRQFIATVATKGIGVPAEFTPAMRKQLTEDLTANLDLYVKDFTVEMVRDLRALVEQNALGGMRTDKLARIIESKFGVSKRKAEFLADQETGLLMAKYREARYSDLGVQEYIWSTSHDRRVRPDHARLDGRRFSFSSPPVVDLASGRRCNPGEDYRCRCVPRPIINLVPASR